jgi:hypothetical protein
MHSSLLQCLFILETLATEAYESSSFGVIAKCSTSNVCCLILFVRYLFIHSILIYLFTHLWTEIISVLFSF